MEYFYLIFSTILLSTFSMNSMIILPKNSLNFDIYKDVENRIDESVKVMELLPQEVNYNLNLYNLNTINEKRIVHRLTHLKKYSQLIDPNLSDSAFIIPRTKFCDYAIKYKKTALIIKILKTGSVNIEPRVFLKGLNFKKMIISNQLTKNHHLLLQKIIDRYLILSNKN